MTKAFNYTPEGPGFVVPPPLEDRPADDATTELHLVRAATPVAVTDSSEETETAALIADLAARLQGVRVLAPSRADGTARQALREELARMVATAQQFDAHLAEPDRAAGDAEHDDEFADWFSAPGGLR